MRLTRSTSNLTAMDTPGILMDLAVLDDTEDTIADFVRVARHITDTQLKSHSDHLDHDSRAAAVDLVNLLNQLTQLLGRAHFAESAHPARSIGLVSCSDLRALTSSPSVKPNNPTQTWPDCSTML